jgi:hypothetical protein
MGKKKIRGVRMEEDFLRVKIRKEGLLLGFVERI